MVTHLSVCGDSFGVGSGLDEQICFEKSFAGVVAENFNLPQRVYARSGCCNFTIYLQVKKIIEQTLLDAKYKPFVLVTTTFHERSVFPLDDGFEYKTPDLSNVEYKSYIPYSEASKKIRNLEFDLGDVRLFSETVSNIQYFQAGKAAGIARLFEKINHKKFEAIATYYSQLFDTGIKKEYDDSLFVTMHSMLKYHNIPHVIMGNISTLYIDKKNLFQNDWGAYARNYPDPGKSGHCNEKGNFLVGKRVIEHINRYKLI